ncbi:MAG: hypothetical protein KBG09_03630 [Syntrophobacterales bacterium]|jgi:electron transfer flavoprotein beta subunit|nr:hypothetical protein [Syntrophobacterales bacterium]
MKILVCIKQILSPETGAATGSSDAEIMKNDLAAGNERSRTVAGQADAERCWRMNPYDEHALEEALQIRERCVEVTIDILSVGPDRCRQVLRRGLELGADRAVQLRVMPPPADDPENTVSSRVSDPPFPSRSFLMTPYETAAAIAAYLADRPAYDLILTGVMAEDGMQGQTGQLLAELLGIPCATAVVNERLLSPRGPIFVEREEDGGDRTAWEIDLPALLTIQSGINRPRYPALSHVLRARKQEITEVDVTALFPAPRERTVNIRRRESAVQCHFLAGPLPEQARMFLDFCRQRGFLS